LAENALGFSIFGIKVLKVEFSSLSILPDVKKERTAAVMSAPMMCQQNLKKNR